MSAALEPAPDPAAVTRRSREMARAGAWSLEALAAEFGCTRGAADRALWAGLGGAETARPPLAGPAPPSKGGGDGPLPARDVREDAVSATQLREEARTLHRARMSHATIARLLGRSVGWVEDALLDAAVVEDAPDPRRMKPAKGGLGPKFELRLHPRAEPRPETLADAPPPAPTPVPEAAVPEVRVDVRLRPTPEAVRAPRRSAEPDPAPVAPAPVEREDRGMDAADRRLIAAMTARIPSFQVDRSERGLDVLVIGERRLFLGRAVTIDGRRLPGAVRGGDSSLEGLAW